MNSTTQEKPNSSWLKTFSIGFSIISVGITIAIIGYIVLTTKQNQTPNQQPTTPSPTTSQPSPTPIIDETANWKTFINIKSANPYSFRYPPDWIISGVSEYLNSVSLSFMNSAVRITFSDGQYPYSFPGPSSFKEEELKIMVAGKEYSVIETTVNNRKAYVDFSTKAPNKIHILFGTGYPAGSDSMETLDEYYKSRETIFKILSTFQFSN